MGDVPTAARRLELSARSLAHAIDVVSPRPSAAVILAVSRGYGVELAWLLVGEAGPDHLLPSRSRRESSDFLRFLRSPQELKRPRCTWRLRVLSDCVIDRAPTDDVQARVLSRVRRVYVAIAKEGSSDFSLRKRREPGGALNPP